MLYYRHTNGYVHGYVVLKKIKMWSSQNAAFDHIFDHLQTRTTWKQCSQEHPKAPFLDTKAPKITRNYTKNLCICVRDAKVVGSNPVASTKKCRKLLKFPAFFICFSIPLSLFTAYQILRADILIVRFFQANNLHSH